MEKLFVLYLRFRFNWAAYILSGTPKREWLFKEGGNCRKDRSGVKMRRLGRAWVSNPFGGLEGERKGQQRASVGTGEWDLAKADKE